MKIRIEVLDDLQEDEVVIRCRQVDDTVKRIHQFVKAQTASGPKLVFYKDNEEYYFPIEEVLFFETESEQVWAHTKNEAFRTKFRLYELEEFLPQSFIRAAKSTIVNTDQIYSIKRELTSTSLIQFPGTHKQVYCSRRYFAALKARMNERRIRNG